MYNELIATFKETRVNPKCIAIPYLLDNINFDLISDQLSDSIPYDSLIRNTICQAADCVGVKCGDCIFSSSNYNDGDGRELYKYLRTHIEKGEAMSTEVKKATLTKDFGKLVSGEEVTIVAKGASTARVKRKDGVEVFIPFQFLKENEVLATPSAMVPPPIKPPRPGVEIGKTELELVQALLANGGELPSSTESSDSGVTDVPFEIPMSEEEKQSIQDAMELHRKRALLVDPEYQLEEYQFRLSDLTDGRLPSSGLDHIITAFNPVVWDSVIREDIPKYMESYAWDADVLEAIFMAHSLNEKILITGLPGTDKTTGIQQYASWINQPYMRFNGKDGIEQSSFLGYPWATENGMEWKDGLLPQGLVAGYLICIDEIFKIPAGIQMAMQNLYEKEGVLLLDDKPGTYHDKLVVPAPEFRLMVTDNVRGTGDNFSKFASTQMQDTSTLDRFGITIEQDYMPQEIEVATLCGMFPEESIRDITKLIKFANLVRSGYKQEEIALTLSMRGLSATLELMQCNLPIMQALQLSFINKLADESELVAVKQLLGTVGIS